MLRRLCEIAVACGVCDALKQEARAVMQDEHTSARRPLVVPRRSMNMALGLAMSAWTHCASEIVQEAAHGSRRPV